MVDESRESARTAIAIEMYAKREAWNIGIIEAAVDCPPAEAGEALRFAVDLPLPVDTTVEQRARLRMIASRCPVQLTLGGDVLFEDRITVVDPTTRS